MGKLSRLVSVAAQRAAERILEQVFGEAREREPWGEDLPPPKHGSCSCEVLESRTMLDSSAWLGAGSDATYDSSTHILDATGPTTIIADPGADAPIIVAAGASAQISFDNTSTTDPLIQLGGLSLTGGATATVQPVTGGMSQRVLVVGSYGPVTAPNFTIDSSSTLDLTNNDMILPQAESTVQTDPTDPTTASTVDTFPMVQSAIAHAYDGGAWDCSGIASSAAAHNPSYALGYAQAATLQLSSFDGQAVDGGATLVKYTLKGDSNLSGAVGLAGYNSVVSNFNTDDANGQDWTDGDFNFAGSVGLADYNDIISNFNWGVTNAPAPVDTDMRLEVDLATGDVSLQPQHGMSLSGYQIYDSAGTLLSGEGDNPPEELIQGSNWNTVEDDGDGLSQEQSLGTYKPTKPRTWDTVEESAGESIDLGDIYDPTNGVRDLAFQYSEGNPVNNNPVTGSTFNGGVDYIAAPTNFTATPIDSTDVRLNWGYGGSTPSAFLVGVAGPTQNINNVTPITVTDTSLRTLTITGLTPGTPYTFRIVAAFPISTSAHPADVTATPPVPTQVDINTPAVVDLPFTDPNASATIAATVNWGNGTTSNATILSPGSGEADTANAVYTYTQGGSYPATVTITDNQNWSETVAVPFVAASGDAVDAAIDGTIAGLTASPPPAGSQAIFNPTQGGGHVLNQNLFASAAGYNFSCVSVPAYQVAQAATLIAPQFVVEANHYQASNTFFEAPNGTSYYGNVVAFQQINGTDLCIGELSSPVPTPLDNPDDLPTSSLITPAAVLAGPYIDNSSAADPVPLLRGSQWGNLSAIEWTGPDTSGAEAFTNVPASSSSLYEWAADPSDTVGDPRQVYGGDSGNGVFALYGGQVICLGALFSGNDFSDLSDNIANGNVGTVMASFNLPALSTQLTYASFPGFHKLSNISLTGPAVFDKSTSSPMVLTAQDDYLDTTVGEETSLVDADTGLVVANSTFQANASGPDTATFNVPAGSAEFGYDTFYAVFGGAANGTVGGSSSNKFNVTVHDVFAQSVVINGDQPALTAVPYTTQRSVIDSVVYTFDQPVVIAAPSTTNPALNAFTIAVDTNAPPSEQSGSVPALTWAPIGVGSGQPSASWSVSFVPGSPDSNGKSINNGVYLISATGANIYSESGAAFAPGRVQTDVFYRLFGDLLGNQTANGQAFALAEADDGLSFGAPGYNEVIDPTGTGAIIGLASYNLVVADFNANYYGFIPTI
jgi:hypothetical protein